MFVVIIKSTNYVVARSLSNSDLYKQIDCFDVNNYSVRRLCKQGSTVNIYCILEVCLFCTLSLRN